MSKKWEVTFVDGTVRTYSFHDIINCFTKRINTIDKVQLVIEDKGDTERGFDKALLLIYTCMRLLQLEDIQEDELALITNVLSENGHTDETELYSHVKNYIVGS